MTEGRLATWNVKEGDEISAGDVIAEVETDKATMEVEATEDGIVHKIIEKPGGDILVGAPIAILKEEGEKVAKDYEPTSQAKTPEEAAPVVAEVKAETATPAPNAPAATLSGAPALPTAQTASAPAVSTGGRIKASPLARRLAAEKGIDIAQVSGTGPHGRVVKADVENAPVGGGARRVVRRSDSEVQLTPMRKSIASRLTQAKQHVPHFYLTSTVNMDNLLSMRQQINAAAGKTEEGAAVYKVSVNDLIIKASALALAKHPEANSAWAGDKLVQFGNVDISVAVSIEGGLITPILQNADQKNVVQISMEMKQLASRARAGELKPEEYTGGSFSISNLGMYGVKTFSAIINPPQAAILACGAAEERALVENGNISSAQMMDMTMSVDHRVIDGALGAELLATTKFYLENPAAMLL
jgi:pyruvate dehydrogenase E2 component (dihydrolipoamide acetyltransferase)